VNRPSLGNLTTLPRLISLGGSADVFGQGIRTAVAGECAARSIIETQD
jgi:hypothetical protein